MNTEKRPVLCTTLYKIPMHPSNCDGIVYQLCHWIFSHGFHQKIRFKRNFKKRPKGDFRQKSNFSPYSDALMFKHDALTKDRRSSVQLETNRVLTSLAFYISRLERVHRSMTKYLPANRIARCTMISLLFLVLVCWKYFYRGRQLLTVLR